MTTQAAAHGITQIDTELVRPRLTSAFLMQEGGRAAFVETGPAVSAPRLLAALETNGIARDAVDYLIVTHVHLDHAGGAGTLLAALPNAKLVVHPRGAKHLIDPSRLIAGATEVYGRERLAAVFGLPVPVPVERVITAADGFRLSLAGRPLRFLDTRGHALHHFVVYDEASRAVFSGDTFGIHFAPLDGVRGAFVFPTSSPVQFDPVAMHASIDRIAALAPERIHVTHFAALVGGVEPAAAALHRLTDAYVHLAQASAAAADPHAAMTERMADLLMAELTRLGCGLAPERQRELIATDIEINVQGLEAWLGRRDRA